MLERVHLSSFFVVAVVVIVVHVVCGGGRDDDDRVGRGAHPVSVVMHAEDDALWGHGSLEQTQLQVADKCH